MLARWKYLAGGLGSILALHLLLSIHPTYRATTSPFAYLPDEWGHSRWSSASPEKGYLDGALPPAATVPQLTGNTRPTLLELKHDELGDRRKANAVFVVLARNSDLWGVAESMKAMEDRFNSWAKYDYVFLNEEEFTEEFKTTVQGFTGGKCIFGKIDMETWLQPDWIDEEKARKSREKMIQDKVIYGHSVPYRNMCRYQSGNFFRHPLLASYDYYWRVEPNIKLFCDITYDPFLLMQDQGKLYGFTLSLYEYHATIPTLWDHVKDFIADHPDYIAPNNAMKFISDNDGQEYNRCHFWSNFEIASFDLWRSKAYIDFFEYLDSKGGFYYERWGDAPVHSIGAALFANKTQLHWFDDIGYRHEPFQHCPQGDTHSRNKCYCNPADNFDWEWYSCTKRYVDLFA